MNCYNDLISYEKLLFSDSPALEMEMVDDYGFVINRIVTFISLRPFFLDKTIRLIQKYCVNPQFKEELVANVSLSCPLIIHRLVGLGVIEQNEIRRYFNMKDHFMLCCYFRKSITDFRKIIEKMGWNENVDLFLENDDKAIDEMIEYGFPLGSLEYSLKFDDIDLLKKLLEDPDFFEYNGVDWNPFEWSLKPKQFDPLSITSHFGSIRCFKYLTLCGHEIKAYHIEQAIYSGSLEIFSICFSQSSKLIRYFCKAVEYCQYQFVDYFFDRISDINEKDGQRSVFFVVILP